MSLPVHPVNDHRARGWVWLFVLSALEGLLALIYLAALPADAENAFLLGFSTRRLALMAILLALSLACASLAWANARPEWRVRWLDPSRNRGLFNALMLMMPAAAIVSGLLLLVLHSLYLTSENFQYYAYYERLLPLLTWTGLVGLQATTWLALAGDFNWPALGSQKAVVRAGAVIFAVFMAVWLLVGLTGLGITPDQIGWGAPAVPLLEWQIWLSLLAGVGLLLFLASRGKFARRGWSARHDILVAALIWLLACGIWLSQPVHTAFFATAGRAPNYEIYPFSDGAYYGLYAQSLLIGNGFQGSQVPPRPFYITLLALFHTLAGQSYEQVIQVQTLLLAFLPVVLYFIGKELHSRPAGLIMALFAILRELTSMITSPITDKASTTQLFFADYPSALAISIWALLAILWLKNPRRPLLSILMGGGMGFAMLFRTQSIFMLPAVLLLALLALRGRWRVWIAHSLLVTLGLILMISPWLLRNYLVTGYLAFDDPKSQTGVMAQRYTLTEDRDLEAEFVIRQDEDLQEFSERVNQGIFQFLFENPGQVARFVTSHLLNAEIDNLLLLPVRDGLHTPKDLIMPSRAFWQAWDGKPSFLQGLLMALNLGVLALGVGAAWARHRWVGISLLLMSISYNASNALARNSGLRYLHPVDWMVYAYAAIGLLQAAIFVLLALGLPAPRLQAALNAVVAQEPKHTTSAGSHWKPVALVGVILLAIGSIPTLAERAYPRRYPVQTQAELAKELLDSSAVQQAATDPLAFEQFLAQPETVILKGRAIYPRYYAAGDGEPRTAKAGYEPLDFSRSLFSIASDPFYGLVMVRAEEPPQALPNATDVLVVGCRQANYIDANLVLILEPESLLRADRALPARCPTDTAAQP